MVTGPRTAIRQDVAVTRVVIVGGGPGGYEAALVAAQLGAAVTVIERDGLGGACVLTDCVPSKTLIASSARMAALDSSAALVRPARAAARADRRRLRGDGRRVRRCLPGARRAGHPGLLPQPRAAPG